MKQENMIPSLIIQLTLPSKMLEWNHIPISNILFVFKFRFFLLLSVYKNFNPIVTSLSTYYVQVYQMSPIHHPNSFVDVWEFIGPTMDPSLICELNWNKVSFIRLSESHQTDEQNVHELLLGCQLGNDFKNFEAIFEHYKAYDPKWVDVNHINNVNTEQGETTITYLDQAVSRGQINFVEYLLKQGADVNRINKDFNLAPIHMAINSQHPKVLKLLLQEPKTDPNLMTPINFRTPLNFALNGNDPTYLRLLLKRGVDINVKDHQEYPIIYYAASKRYTDEFMRLLIEYCGSEIDVDSFVDRNGQTCREILLENFPNFPLNLLPPFERAEDDVHLLYYYLYTKDRANFFYSLREIGIDSFDEKTVMALFEKVIAFNFIESAKLILGFLKHDPKALEAAAKRVLWIGCYQILEECFTLNHDIANRLLFEAVYALKRRHEISDQLRCFKLILDEKNVDLEQENEFGETPLRAALFLGCDEVVIQLLLSKGCYIGHTDEHGEPIISLIPVQYLLNYFDSCIDLKSSDRKKTLMFDYRCLNPNRMNLNMKSENNGSQPMEMEVFKYIARNEDLKNLLNHPLLALFLCLKCRDIRNIMWANFVTHLVFYVCITTYILIEMDPTVCQSNTIQTVIYFGTITTLIFVTILETMQFSSSPHRFICNKDNWLGILLIVLSVILLVRNDHGYHKIIASMIVIISSYKLFIWIGHLPTMSIKIEIFKKVFINFVEFFLSYALLIVSFAFAFSILFKNDNKSFTSIGETLVKTTVMFTGEFDVSSFNFDEYPIWGRMIFMLFVFIVSLVLLNLLSALAICDTVELYKKVELSNLICRTEILYHIERIAMGNGFPYTPVWFRGFVRSIVNNPRNPFFLGYKCRLFTSVFQESKFNYDLSTDSVKIKNEDSILKKATAIFFNRNYSTCDDQFILALRKSTKKVTAIENDFSNGDKIIFALNELNKRVCAIENNVETMKQSMIG